jgi:predicted nucleic acid-binding protein
LDTSVLLAACGSATGSSRFIADHAHANSWTLLSSPWVLVEVVRNLLKLPTSATSVWAQIRPRLVVVDDVVSLDRVVVFPASKDRPVLLTALAAAQVLLTLDRADFAEVLGRHFYGMPILLPAEFLAAERRAGRVR